LQINLFWLELVKESFRDRFKDNFKVYNKELKTDNYGIHSPGAANYNTTIGTENL